MNKLTKELRKLIDKRHGLWKKYESVSDDLENFVSINIKEGTLIKFNRFIIHDIFGGCNSVSIYEGTGVVLEVFNAEHITVDVNGEILELAIDDIIEILEE